MSELVCYADGACSPNPGAGGYGVLMLNPATKEAIGIAQGFCQTTNNRMEIQAIMMAIQMVTLEWGRGHQLIVWTDSQYALNCFHHWIKGWKKNGWQGRNGGEVKNRDLLEKLDETRDYQRTVIKWVKGHSGNPGNDCVDALAKSAMRMVRNQQRDERDVHVWQGIPWNRIRDVRGADIYQAKESALMRDDDPALTSESPSLGGTIDVIRHRSALNVYESISGINKLEGGDFE